MAIMKVHVPWRRIVLFSPLHRLIVAQEFDKHDRQPEKYVKLFSSLNPKTGTHFTCDVGYERFLGPEVFFNPDIYSADHSTPLPQVCLFRGVCRL